MAEQMTKAKLLENLKTKRAEWDAALADVPQSTMTEPGAAGKWSVKDIVAHVTHLEKWIADRLHEHLRGEVYVPVESDMMEEDAQNEVFYQRDKDRTLDDILMESRESFDRLVEGVEAHPESFLIEPQQFEYVPQPIVIWDLLRGNVYDHYQQHIPSLKEWAASHHK